MSKKSFVMYLDWKAAIDTLSDEDAGKLLKAIMEYAHSGEVPELPTQPKMAFTFMASALERDSAKWEETKQKRSRAGKKGGAPKGNTNAAKSREEIQEYNKRIIDEFINENVN